MVGVRWALPFVVIWAGVFSNVSVVLRGLALTASSSVNPRAVHEHPDLRLAAVRQGGGGLLVAGCCV